MQHFNKRFVWDIFIRVYMIFLCRPFEIWIEDCKAVEIWIEDCSHLKSGLKFGFKMMNSSKFELRISHAFEIWIENCQTPLSGPYESIVGIFTREI